MQRPRLTWRRTRIAAAAVVAAPGVLLAVHGATQGAGPGRSVALRTAGQDSVVRQFYDSLDALDARIPAEAVEIEALAHRLGADPGAAVAFVADSIAFEPYDGVLRGAFGTLVSRAGNACDQALLLRGLLRAAGVTAHLRTATTDPELEVALRARARRNSAARAVPLEGDTALVGAARATLGRVLSLLPEAPGEEAPATDAVGVHCWVEYDSPAGAVEADPVLGRPPSAASEVHSDIPERLRTRLTVRVVMEGETAPLVEASFAVDTLDFEPITVVVAPGDPQFSDRLAQAADAQEVVGELAGYFPVIGFRGAWTLGRGFNLAGQVLEPEAPQALPGGNVLGNRLDGMLGGGLGGRGEVSAPARPTSVTTWIEYGLDRPDGTAWGTRRPLFLGGDTAEPSGLAPLGPLTERQVLVPTFPASPIYVLSRFVRFYRENRAVVEALAQPGDSSGAATLRQLRRYPWPLLALAVAQDRIAADLGADGAQAGDGVAGPALYRGEPGLLVLTEAFEIRNGRLLRTLGIDLGRTGFQAAPQSPRARRLRGELGVASSILESRALEGPDTRSLVGLAALADSTGIPLVALTGPDDPDLDRLAITPSQRALLLEELDAGHLVVSLERPVAPGPGPGFGWWRVDPRSGEVLGVLENREGGVQAATEYHIWHAVGIGAAAGALAGYAWCRILSDDPALARHYNRPQWPPNQCWRAAACGAVFGGLAAGFLYLAPSTTAGGVWLTPSAWLVNQGITAGILGGGGGVMGPPNLPSVCGFTTLARPPR